MFILSAVGGIVLGVLVHHIIGTCTHEEICLVIEICHQRIDVFAANYTKMCTMCDCFKISS